jgi:Leucine-rich repeat (LRR) protein
MSGEGQEVNLGGRNLSWDEVDEDLKRIRTPHCVHHLILSNNNFAAPGLPPCLDKFSHLLVLDLSMCKLTDSSVLARLTSLEVLNLAWNFLTESGALSTLSKLRRLNLIGNNLSTVDFWGLPHLEILHLSQNRLKRVRLVNTAHLHTLSLSRNGHLPTKLQTCATQSPERVVEMLSVANLAWQIDLEAVSFLFCWKVAERGSLLSRLPRDMSRLIATTILKQKQKL